jgi:hypothetical protein
LGSTLTAISGFTIAVALLLSRTLCNSTARPDLETDSNNVKENAIGIREFALLTVFASCTQKI